MDDPWCQGTPEAICSRPPAMETDGSEWGIFFNPAMQDCCPELNLWLGCTVCREDQDISPSNPLEALGLRAVACKGWRWMPGMRAGYFRILAVSETGACIAPEGSTEDGHYASWVDSPLLSLPDLSDPATLGCLVALVREAWNDPYLSTMAEFRRNGTVTWHIRSDAVDRPALWDTLTAETEAEVLVAALEGAS